MKKFIIGSKKVGLNLPTYFIADIAANHDGNLNKAIDLVHSCAEAGANAAKFQHFSAETIVSDRGFKSLNKKFLSHQKKWKKSVFEVYKDASINLKWTTKLKQACKEAKVDFLSTPYSYFLADHLYKHIPAYKIGSGDANWIEFISYVAKKKKPILIATGATNIKEVENLVKSIYKINKKIVLMQCNTNYTGQQNNLEYVNLNVLDTFKTKYKNSVILGLSDHTFGHVAVLGAVAKGARVIEKHFTDNNKRIGPDHHFAMNPKTWKEMVKATRDLEKTLGDGIKKVEKNEINAKIVQQRSIRAIKLIKKGDKLKRKDLICLRPKSNQGLEPYFLSKILGTRAKKNIKKHEELNWKKIK